MLNFLKRCLRLPYFPIILAPIILFSGALFSGRILFWGLPVLQFIPWREFAWASLQNGQLPLWNPFNGMGAPLIANYQLAFFYPPGWLVYLFAAIGGTQLMAWSHSLLVVLHLIWAGLGMAGFARSLGLSELAQTISGLAFSLSGYLVARNSFYSIIWAAAWLPWIMYAVNEIVKQEKRNFSFKMLFLVVFQLLAGHAQLTWYTLLLAGLWLVILSWAQSGYKRALENGLIYGLTLLAGIALTAIQLFPTAEFLLQSQRSSAVDFELGLTYSFWPWHGLNLLSPDFFGNPGSGTYFGYAAYWEDAIYIGLIPLIFSLSTFQNLLPGRSKTEFRQKTQVKVLWIVIALSIIFGLGKNTPIFPWLYQHIPTFGMFNAPARWMVWAVFCLCALAGIGVDAWQAPVGKALRRYKIWLVITIAVALGAGITYLGLKEVRLTFIQATAVAGLWGALYCLAAIKRPKNGREHRLWTAIFVGLVALDLISAQWSLIPTAPPALVAPARVNTPVPSGQRVYLAYQDEYTLKFERFFRIEDFNPVEAWANIWEVLLPNTNLNARVAYVNNFDPLLPDRYTRVVDFLNQLSPSDRLPWLKLANVGSVESIDPNVPAGVNFSAISASGRFQWFGCAQYAKTETEAWDMTRSLVAGRQIDSVVIESSGPAQVCTTSNPATIQVVQDRTDSLVVTVADNGSSGWLLMADTWYPGWTATVDGSVTPVRRADFFMRAVQLTAGRHTVKIEYKPQVFQLGEWVSLLSWTITLMIILIVRLHFPFRNKL